MRYLLTIFLLMVALVAGSCGGKQAVEAEPARSLSYEPLLGSSLAGISIQNSDQRLSVSSLDRSPYRFPQSQLFPYSLKNENIGINSHTNGEDHTGYTG